MLSTTTPKATSHFQDYCDRLFDAFVTFDEEAAAQQLDELFADYDAEEVIQCVIHPTLQEVGNRWHDGTLLVANEHFASTYIKRRLLLLFHAQPLHLSAPLIVVACAEKELHEIGLLTLAHALRQRGGRVVYLGQDLPLSDIPEVIEALQPAMVILSATSENGLRSVVETGRLLSTVTEPCPWFCFGGAAATLDPELAAQVQGINLGTDAIHGAEQALALLAGPGDGGDGALSND